MTQLGANSSDLLRDRVNKSDGRLATPACLFGRLGLLGEVDPGELSLSEGIVAFKSDAHGLVFRAPLEEVQPRFPKRYFGLGFKLAVGDKVYRLWFVVPFRATRKEETPLWVPGVFRVFETSDTFYLTEGRPARAAVRQWRAALLRPIHGG
jgi:hypothetical protein